MLNAWPNAIRYMRCWCSRDCRGRGIVASSLRPGYKSIHPRPASGFGCWREPRSSAAEGIAANLSCRPLTAHERPGTGVMALSWNSDAQRGANFSRFHPGGSKLSPHEPSDAHPLAFPWGRAGLCSRWREDFLPEKGSGCLVGETSGPACPRGSLSKGRAFDCWMGITMPELLVM